MLWHAPYHHVEYYRYLNCGYRLPLVGGTDKMSSDVPVGLYRTYARIPDDEEFSYEAWCRSVAEGRTFLSGGPIIHLSVDGREVGDTVSVQVAEPRQGIAEAIGGIEQPHERGLRGVDLVVALDGSRGVQEQHPDGALAVARGPRRQVHHAVAVEVAQAREPGAELVARGDGAREAALGLVDALGGLDGAVVV